jgi:DNA (cytosine-5)-methyltransferase 1
MTSSIIDDVRAELGTALQRAEAAFAEGRNETAGLTGRMRSALDVLNANAQRASSVFTNIVTCLAIKAARPDVDVRYHQTQIQGESHTTRGAGFNFRGVSEDVVYPWLDHNRFQGAKSGWQTRTLERPKPYTMSYDENIGAVKHEFLAVFDELEECCHPALPALTYLVLGQVVYRESVQITLSVPKTQDITTIIALFGKHFFRDYKGFRGASRLPVLAIHAVYASLVPELKRFQGCTVRPLNEHSAADSQTGSIGDVEVADAAGNTFEAVEVKHRLPISAAIIAGVRDKIKDKNVSRYYVLTTHTDCEPDGAAKAIIENVKALYECQVIANGVMPTIRYYLRLLENPNTIFPTYAALLRKDKAIAHEHRTAWNEAVEQLGP